MQELIDYIDSIWSNSGWEETIKEKANDLLEKEKEQIMKAYCDGFDELLPFHENDYYSQAYNQDRELPKDVKDMLDNL